MCTTACTTLELLLGKEKNKKKEKETLQSKKWRPQSKKKKKKNSEFNCLFKNEKLSRCKI